MSTAAPKYKNKKTVVDEYTFDSHAEALYYIKLKEMKEKGIIDHIEVHPKFPIQNGFWKCDDCAQIFEADPTSKKSRRGKCTFCGKKLPKISAITYIADFKVDYADGHSEVVDVKGMETEAFKIKRKLFEFKYPTLVLKIVKR